MNPLDALLADLAETLGNALLNLDADAKERLAELEGRCIRIECLLPRKSATLTVQRSRIAVSAEAIGEADAVVQGSMTELIAWVVGGASAESAAVRIEGDPGALAEVRAAITPSLVSSLSGTASNSPGEDALGALELAAAGLRSAAEGAAHAIERGLAPSADGLSPLAQLTPGFELLREGVLDLARKAQELAKPTRGEPS
ncbi:MAG: SCP2 sterol-binding domain-containing protein [Gammaproteobacteria bacterium]|nr:SCP2 sterol-binding domain-containing protein [Gammaproteobacteria bacterium]